MASEKPDELEIPAVHSAPPPPLVYNKETEEESCQVACQSLIKP
jgi:hypothetical protein